MELFVNFLLLILGMVLLIKGADFFVEGSSNVAKYFKIPSLIIGLTLVSIGTSLPETSVSVSSALQGKSDLSFGNVIGSNIFNVLVVIGCCSLIKPMVVSKGIIKFDIPIYVGIIALLAIFAFAITPFEIVWYEALILFLIFLGYMVFVVFRAKKNPEVEAETTEEETKKKKPMWLNIIFIIGGLAAIIVGGELVVKNASDIALYFGMSELLVGLTIVAVGTSLPELVTSMVATKKGEVDIAVGNAIGSCLFNIILILGLSGMINNITLQPSSYIDLIIMSVSVILIFLFSFKKLKVNRIQGLILVLTYVLYLAFVIYRN